jgi:hypothetical protein
MRFKLLLTISCLGLAVTTSGFGATITTEYRGSFLEGSPGVDQGLPIYLSQSPNNARFQFYVPNYSLLTSIDSIAVSVDVYNNQANSFENGALLFVLNGVGLPNLTVQTFSNLSGFTDSSPLSVSGSVSPGDLSNALLEIQGDGIFFLRVNRDGNNRQGNDFYVANPTVTIDGAMAVSIPEPASVWLLAAGLLAGSLKLRRKARP